MPSYHFSSSLRDLISAYILTYVIYYQPHEKRT